MVDVLCRSAVVAGVKKPSIPMSIKNELNGNNQLLNSNNIKTENIRDNNKGDDSDDNLSAKELAPLKNFFDTLKSQLEGAPPARKRKLILNALKQLKVEEVKKYFPPLVSRRNAPIFRLKMMLDAQIFSVTFDEKIFFNIMEKYFRIKLERNQSNHAREDEGEFHSAHELRDFMLSALDELDAVLNK